LFTKYICLLLLAMVMLFVSRSEKNSRY